MPKTKQPKKATSKQRQAPYPTPPRPASNLRSTAAAPLIPSARVFEPPPGLDLTHLLTPHEQRQSFLEWIKDRQNVTSRPHDVGEGGTHGDGHLPDNSGHNEDASDDPEVGVSWGGRTGAVEEAVGEDGVDQGWNGSTTSGLGGEKDQQSVTPPEDDGKGKHPLEPHSATPKPLTEDEIWLERLRPVVEYNKAMPWPVSFYEQPIPAPAWYAECPEGYEPTTLAGYPIRRQYQSYIPAAHDPELVRDEYGHYCVDLRETREWDQCCMGKCERCEICRPGL
ncbi:hypothetical protein KCU78_g16573, partial [Aureobasidium melanogenum]